MAGLAAAWRGVCWSLLAGRRCQGGWQTPRQLAALQRTAPEQNMSWRGLRMSSCEVVQVLRPVPSACSDMYYEQFNCCLSPAKDLSLPGGCACLCTAVVLACAEADSGNQN
jgi:hypothetical protein